MDAMDNDIPPNTSLPCDLFTLKTTGKTTKKTDKTASKKPGQDIKPGAYHMPARIQKKIGMGIANLPADAMNLFQTIGGKDSVYEFERLDSTTKRKEQFGWIGDLWGEMLKVVLVDQRYVIVVALIMGMIMAYGPQFKAYNDAVKKSKEKPKKGQVAE